MDAAGTQRPGFDSQAVDHQLAPRRERPWIWAVLLFLVTAVCAVLVGGQLALAIIGRDHGPFAGSLTSHLSADYGADAIGTLRPRLDAALIYQIMLDRGMDVSRESPPAEPAFDAAVVATWEGALKTIIPTPLPPHARTLITPTPIPRAGNPSPTMAGLPVSPLPVPTGTPVPTPTQVPSRTSTPTRSPSKTPSPTRSTATPTPSLTPTASVIPTLVPTAIPPTPAPTKPPPPPPTQTPAPPPPPPPTAAPTAYPRPTRPVPTTYP